MPRKTARAKKAKVDPLDEALQAKEKLAARKQEDLEMWQQWRADPSPQNTNMMLKRLEPVFKSFEQTHKAPRTNAAAMRLVLKEHALKAAESFKPEMGASFPTWVQSNIRSAQRFNIEQQNVGRISEGNVSHIGRINRATDALKEQLRRDPTHEELAAHLNVSAPARRQLTAQKIKQIQTQANRADVPTTAFESDPTPSASQLSSQVVSLLPDRFARAGKHDHLKAMDLMYNQGINDSGAMAKHLGWSNSKVSRIKTDIENEYRTAQGMPLRGAVKKQTK